MADQAQIRFDGWTLSRVSGELTRDGQTQRLAPQPLAMLLELLDHAGEVVTREALVKILWPRGIVDFDNSLNAVVRKLRTVLGDDAEAPRYVETLPRIGYRFVGRIEMPGGAAPSSEVAMAAKTPALAIRWPLLGLVLLIGAVVAMTLFLRSGPNPPRGSLALPEADGPSAGAIPRRTTNERAYDLYLQGIFNRSRRDTNAGPLAIENFEAALALDPHYADAWAGLAETLSGAALSMQWPVVPTFGRAKTAAMRAIELDTKLGHGHAALGTIYLHFDRDFAKAETELDIARPLDPAYGRTWHSLALLRAFQGRVPEAFEAIRRARELEPMSLLYLTNFGVLLLEARRYDEAIAHAQLLLSSQPRLDAVRTVLIRALVAKGDIDAALAQLPMRVSERVNLSDAGLVYAHAGRVTEARAEIESIERIGKDGFGVAFDIAVIEAALGNKAAACAALNRAIDDHSLRLPWMRLDPAMDTLREEACFKDVWRKLYG